METERVYASGANSGDDRNLLTHHTLCVFLCSPIRTQRRFLHCKMLKSFHVQSPFWMMKPRVNRAKSSDVTRRAN